MRRIWNYINYQVYSLSTIDPEGVGNMNICTYVSAYSMDPKKFMIAVYKNTKTLDNLKIGNKAILQVLSSANIVQVRRFGYKSGREQNKLKGLEKILEWQDNIPYLTNSFGIIFLTLEKLIVDNGDHEIGIFVVNSQKVLNEKSELLTTQMLKSANILS